MLPRHCCFVNRFRCGIVLVLVIAFLGIRNFAFAAAPAPGPTATPEPSIVANAWGLLFQTRRFPLQLNRNPNAQRDALLSALRILRAENDKAASPAAPQIAAQIQLLTDKVMADPNSSELQDGIIALQKLYDPKLIEQANTLAERYRCPMHPEVVGRMGEICSKCGMPLSSLVRLSADAVAPQITRMTIKARVETDGPLEIGRQLKGHLSLTSLRAGAPVTFDDLREVHTRKIHLLIIDGSLTDYHHVHPVPTQIPGRYDFDFIPQKPGPYRLWADLQPIATDIQEFAMALIPADSHSEPLQREPDRLTTTVNGLQYTLSFDRPLKSFEPALGTLHIARIDGAGFDQLEPIMGAFAHIVGFREDRTTALHIHPELARPLMPGDRGGPDLHFRFYATKAGFYRLFVQVQRNGIQEFARFAVNVALGQPPPGWEKNNCSSGRSRPTVSFYGIRITEITLPKRRVGTAHRCKDDGDPSRQTSRGLRDQLEQGTRRQS
jgi:hypothetical protein